MIRCKYSEATPPDCVFRAGNSVDFYFSKAKERFAALLGQRFNFCGSIFRNNYNFQTAPGARLLLQTRWSESRRGLSSSFLN